jgi:hypothetical protein
MSYWQNVKLPKCQIDKMSWRQFLPMLSECFVRTMDKLLPTGRNLGRVFNFRSDRMYDRHLPSSIPVRPNLELKTRPKQLLGSLRLYILLPSWQERWNMILKSKQIIPTHTHLFSLLFENTFYKYFCLVNL